MEIMQQHTGCVGEGTEYNTRTMDSAECGNGVGTQWVRFVVIFMSSFSCSSMF